MKAGIHPNYRPVVLHDTSIDHYFVIGSALQTDQTIEWQGKTYPYMAIDVSSESHSFYTGKQRAVQQEGRIANFNRRFSRFGAKEQ